MTIVSRIYRAVRPAAASGGPDRAADDQILTSLVQREFTDRAGEPMALNDLPVNAPAKMVAAAVDRLAAARMIEVDRSGPQTLLSLQVGDTELEILRARSGVSSSADAGPYAARGRRADHARADLVHPTADELPGEDYTAGFGTVSPHRARVLAECIDRIVTPVEALEGNLQDAFVIDYAAQTQLLYRWVGYEVAALPVPARLLRHAAALADDRAYPVIGCLAAARAVSDIELLISTFQSWATQLTELVRAAGERDQLRHEISDAAGGVAEHQTRFDAVLGRLGELNAELLCDGYRVAVGDLDQVGRCGEGVLAGTFRSAAAQLQNLLEVDIAPHMRVARAQRR